MNPRYPVFIPTKGRSSTPYTIRALQRLGVPFHAVVESQDYDNYRKILPDEQLLVLPHQDKGLVFTRNWIWDYALSLGVKRFWTFDDNIRDFFYMTGNIKYRMTSGSSLYIIEDFAERFENAPIVGMQYEMFAPRKRHWPPLVLNTRVYSNMLIETDFRDPRGKPYRNEGFYNDDTDLCLRVLKDGNCTILTNVFLADKLTTMRVKGGMTSYYQGDGRWKMAEELRQKHPDVTKIVHKWGRWQHQVDYRPFKSNQLRLKPGVEILDGVNNYGMKLVHLSES